jgi:geranylgeranyl diphosphate synthase, type II
MRTGSVEPPTDAATTAAALEEWRGVVERGLGEALPAEDVWPATIHRAVRYSLFAGGKRIRPALVLAAGEATGGERVDLMPLACSVEMIHTYSLIHDDLPAMDDDDLRRGKPTSHKVFGEAIAILAGDALLTRAFHLLAEGAEDLDEVRLRRRMAAAAILGEACGTRGLIGGQVQDLESEGRLLDARGLERLHRAKTGALLEACVRGGAVLSGAGADDAARLGRYAAAIGLAFQIVDDVLDATEQTEQLGKSAGKDDAARKATYVSVHGIDRSRTMARELLDQALDAVGPFGPRGVPLAGIAKLIVTRRA